MWRSLLVNVPLQSTVPSSMALTETKTLFETALLEEQLKATTLAQQLRRRQAPPMSRTSLLLMK